MNKVIICGRLTKDPETRYTQDGTAISRYTLAVDRYTKDKTTADFIPCIAFGKAGEFAEKYLKKGTKILVEGNIKTGSYENKEGKKVYTVDVLVERHEFCESKSSEHKSSKEEPNDEIPNGFERITDEDMPF